ncbi:hypothetical protein ACJRO7_001412 [Eucalyptus globulus]|uniref:Uncharacterized protein n=1 Tax=Eucalyptus globulus TaxID=34317 RepID=A0ABD3M0R5_EUCGL
MRGKNPKKPSPSSDRGIEDNVKDLIEKCLQLYMAMDQVIIALRDNFNIEPRLTVLVWTKLQEDNPEFFRDYYIRLKLIKQISEFNQLLEQQRQHYEQMPQAAFEEPSLPQAKPSPEIAGGIYQQQLSNAAPVQYGDNVLGGMRRDHCASIGTGAVASMQIPVQAHSLQSINQNEFLTHACSKQATPSYCCKQGAIPSAFDIQNQGRFSLPSNPASSSVPAHGEFEPVPEANQLDSLDFLLDSPDHQDDTGQLPDMPPESHPGSQKPGNTY